MSDYFCIRIVDGRYQVGITTDGRDFVPIPRAAFDEPGDAIRYADMRQARVTPLREAVEDPEGLADEGFLARSTASRSGSTLPAGPGPSSTARGRRLGDPDNPSPIQGAGHSCSLGGIPARRVGRAAPPPETELRALWGDR